MAAEPDFSGYVTRYGVKCTDGRTILPHAFKHQDSQSVPLVWQHQHSSPDNVLGHLVLKHRDDGVWVDGYFNETKSGKNARDLVHHKDINKLSIHANRLVQHGLDVQHGNIIEGSLVLAGANAGAFIENVNMRHADGFTVELEDDVIIHSGETIVLSHSVSDPDNDGDNDTPGSTDDPDSDAPEGGDDTVASVLASLSPKQTKVVYGLIGKALNHSANAEDPSTDAGDGTDTDTNAGDQGEPAGGADDKDKEGTVTHSATRNVFDQDKGDAPGAPTGGYVLTHADEEAIFAQAQKRGSLKAAIEDFAISHGIDNISALFPEYKAVSDTPEFISRRMAWVNTVLNGVRHTPFARIKQLFADITMDQARAKGYIKGTMKTEEWFAVSKRTTDPKTVYKKQKLDRDDILDITDFDAVNWVQGEMRIMLDEEVARAILFGDGRDIADPDKIDETKIRPVATDHDLYTTKVTVNTGASGYSAETLIEAIVENFRWYYGTGRPTLYCTYATLSSMLLLKDTLGRRIYPTMADLLAAMPGIGDIQTCEVMEQDTTGLIAVIVNLADYNVGTNNGGEVTPFTFFDIDYNQEKFLLETRFSGALVKYKAALAVYGDATGSDALVVPTTPTFNASTGVVTIPTKTGVTYTNADTGATLTAGAQAALDPDTTLNVEAVPASGYYFSTSATANWRFTRPAS
jgi:HK97 family phage prohead protease